MVRCEYQLFGTFLGTYYNKYSQPIYTFGSALSERGRNRGEGNRLTFTNHTFYRIEHHPPSTHHGLVREDDRHRVRVACVNRSVGLLA